MCALSETVSRKAFTLIEVLVVVSVIAILLALVIPGVQSAREAGRRLECSSKLSQLGVASHSFHSVMGHFAFGMMPDSRDADGVPSAVGPASVFCQLLPHLDQQPLFNSINLQLGRQAIGPAGTHYSTSQAAENATAARTLLGTLLCPSDSSYSSHGCNYRACAGSRPYVHDVASIGGGGSYPGLYATRASDFLDGLSNTAGASERVHGSGLATKTPGQSDMSYTRLFDMFGRRCYKSEFLFDACPKLEKSVSEFNVDLGKWWIEGAYAETEYNHVAPPNWSHLDCSANLRLGLASDVTVGIISARSYHPSGVNVLMMDGSVRFMRNSVAVDLWRAIGTRAAQDFLGRE